MCRAAADKQIRLWRCDWKATRSLSSPHLHFIEQNSLDKIYEILSFLFMILRLRFQLVIQFTMLQWHSNGINGSWLWWWIMYTRCLCLPIVPYCTVKRVCLVPSKYKPQQSTLKRLNHVEAFYISCRAYYFYGYLYDNTPCWWCSSDTQWNAELLMNTGA